MFDFLNGSHSLNVYTQLSITLSSKYAQHLCLMQPKCSQFIEPAHANTNHFVGCMDLSSFNHEWRVKVLQSHNAHVATKMGTQALAPLRRKPLKGDSSHRGYLRMPQQAFCTLIFDYPQANNISNKALKLYVLFYLSIR